MANKGIFMAELMASTELGSLLRSVQSEAEVENGSICTLGALIDPENHLYSYGAVADISDAIYFVDGVEIIKDETITYGLDDFVNEAERPFRVRKPQVGDTFSISASMIDAIATSPVEGNVVVTKVGTKIAEATEATTESFVAKIEKLYNHGTRQVPMARLVVTKA